MNRRQKKKKNTKYEYTFGDSYTKTRKCYRKIHEKRVILKRKGLI